MRSIRTKIISLTLIAILVSLLTIGAIGIFSIKRVAENSSDREMRLLNETNSRALNEYMNSIEQSVSLVSRYAVEGLDSIRLMEGGVIGFQGDGSALDGREWDAPRQAVLDEYLAGFLAEVEGVSRSVANHASGVITYYFRLNPEISRDVPGFWQSKSKSSSFASQTPTDIFAYEPSDVSRVGWYFLPLQRGRPSWISPYYNQNLGIKMISYVMPIYKSGTFIGVIGMDIAYTTLISQVDNIRIYDSGYAFLVDADGYIVYHPYLESGLNVTEYVPDLIDDIQESRSGSGSTVLATYLHEDTRRKAACSTLSNDLTLIITAPLEEINRTWTKLINAIVVAGSGILGVFGLIMFITMKHITEPLKRLTAASQRLADGDYDVKLTYTGLDEVGILTGAFQRLVDHLKIYIQDLNSKAYKDALTGVRNKGAFDISARQLDDQIRAADSSRPIQFAVVMLDCNDLKKINDVHGHAMGDIYLQTACTLICNIFAHSPVFRVGGDEFAAILQGQDYINRDLLMREFDQRAAEINARAQNPWERVGLAKGMAVYDPAQDPSTEAVLERADKLMYENKKKMKVGRD